MRSLIALLSLSLVQTAVCIGQNATLAFNRTQGSVQLASKSAHVQLVLDGADWPGVLRASHDVAADFGRVTGVNGSVQIVNGGHGGNGTYPNGTVSHGSTIFNVTGKTSWSLPATGGSAGGMIIAGTVGNSSLIDNLVKSGKLDVSEIEGKWEAFVSTVIKSPLSNLTEALVIAGSDKRGTIYGLYDISEQIGVSPWYWMADSPPQTKEEIYAINITKVQKSPSVKYRGFFINDEAPALTGWINANFPRGKYGAGYNANFYAHVFELLLRLRANYLWPAMWGSMFGVDDPRNQPLADEFGVVMGTSHTEPLTRATNEWGNFGKGPWQWNENNETIYKFLEEGAKRSAKYENVWTMGMRGYHDTAMSEDIVTEQLESVVTAEREILKNVLGSDTDAPQMWCLYKEVQGYYEQGMRVPEDITLLWAEDNWGNTRRLPLPSETNRTGGAGVYYHFDYVGDPVNYKWINTIQLQRTWEQMSFAYERGAQIIWIVNVGDIKPSEIPISHFFDLAYDVTSYDKDSTTKWLQAFAAREFGAEYAEDIANVINTYSILVGRRKFEMVNGTTYNALNYLEAERVLKEWEDLASNATAINDKLPSEAKAAYFEMVLHPVLAGGNLHDIHISAALNRIYAGQGRNSANRMAERVLQKFDYDYELTEQYHGLLNGKWEHMMDQTHLSYNGYWQQPMREYSPMLSYVQTKSRALTGDMGIAIESSQAVVPGDDRYHANSGNSLTVPPIDPYSPDRYIDIFSVGNQPFDFKLTTEPHIKLSQASGTLDPTGNSSDVRVWISVDWSSAPSGATTAKINATSSTNYGAQFSAPQILVPVNHTSVPSDFSGFVESDGHIAIEAEHYSRVTPPSSAPPDFPSYTTPWAPDFGTVNGTELEIVTIPNYGRTLSAIALFPRTAPSLSATTAPIIEYDVYTFSSLAGNRTANDTVFLAQSLNTIPSRPLKYALAVDDGEPSVVQYVKDQDKGRTPVDWDKAVSNAGWESKVALKGLERPGKHTIKLWLLEPGVMVQRFWVDFGGVRSSYLGPPESTRVGGGE